MASPLHVSILFLLLPIFHLTNSANSSSSSSCCVQPFCHHHELSALLHFKKSFNIVRNSSPSRCSSSWNNHSNITSAQDSNCCSWHGVHCDDTTGHVIGLDLSSSCLFGSINSNSTLFALLHLQTLNLAHNNFNFSSIPSTFARLSDLTHLNLSGSRLSGQIPSEITELSKLRSLDLSKNPKLELEYPDLGSLVRNFSNLERLHLSEVNLSSKVPPILANLTSLTSIFLDDCELFGDFPSGVFLLPNLQVLSVMYNEDLNGKLPEFHGSSPLEALRLADTSFSGVLPSTIGNLGSLHDLHIWYCNLSGSIPDSLGNLTQLVHLNFGFNSFVGHFPFGVLSNLTKLETLKLQYNNFGGEIISSFGNHIKLTTLFLGSNQFNGTIPSQFGNNSQIAYLDLSNNMLQGLVPSAIFELHSLTLLDLSCNHLRGHVELDRFLQLKNLTTLHLSENSLSLQTRSKSTSNDPNFVHKFKQLGLSSCNLSEFPSFIRNQDELEWLELSHNNIGGSIPSWLWNTSRDTLLFMNLSSNSLTGFHQPPGVFPWSRLAILDLGSNMLRGSLPYPSPTTVFYSISNNLLAGELSPTICEMSSLIILDLSENMLSGAIPHCLSNLSHSLSILNLRGNNFEGSFPQIWEKGSPLKMISLSHNKLEGTLPRSLAKCAMLECIDVSENLINDTFPSWLGNLPNLKVLILRSNSFHGEIKNLESNFMTFPKLGIIDLSSNNFAGKMPSHLFLNWNPLKIVREDHLTYLQFNFSCKISNDNAIEMMWYVEYAYSMTIDNKGLMRKYEKIEALFTAIDFSRNLFDGSIPRAIGHLKGLHLLNLSNNFLTGNIPSFIGNLIDLESLDLSHNKLSGQIPQQLTRLTFLEVFNVSHNFLVGPIPRGTQFDTFENSSFDGNRYLCGDPLSRKCGKLEISSPPASTFEEDQEHRSLVFLNWKIVVLGYACGFVVGLVIGNLMFKRMYVWFVEAFGWRKHKFS